MAGRSLRDLISAGRLAPGERLVATHRGARYSAEVTAEAAIRIDGGGSFKSPSSAAGSITGHNTNGWQFWRIEQTGKPLAYLRSTAE
jgi:Restriction Enzyme Adenine Methylase Associated